MVSSDLSLPHKVEARSLTLGEVLAGDRMAQSMYSINFKGKPCQSISSDVTLLPFTASSLESFDRKELCTVQLDAEELAQLKEAIEDLYYFEFVYGECLEDVMLVHHWKLSLPPSLPDEIRIRGFIGHLEEGSFLPHHHQTFLWTHLHFNMEYNKDQVISANVSTLGVNPLSLDDLDPPVTVTFTYSAKWFPTTYVCHMTVM